MVYLFIKAEGKNLPGKKSINVMPNLIFMPIKTVSVVLPTDHLPENLIQKQNLQKKESSSYGIRHQHGV